MNDASQMALPNLHMFAHVSTCQHMLPKNHFRGYRVSKKGCLSGFSAAQMGLSSINALKMDFNRDNKRGIIHITNKLKIENTGSPKKSRSVVAQWWLS